MMLATLAPICPAPEPTASMSTPPGAAAHGPLMQIAWRRAMRWFKPPVSVAGRHVGTRPANATPVATAEHALRPPV
jgi:hypothetical protein